jgi:MFS-type transporter involved in bile tolerance (Atg22 family)
VFQSINILHRVALSAVCSLPFFHAGTNIRFAYLLCAAIVLVYAIPLVLNYRQLAAMKEETGQG